MVVWCLEYRLWKYSGLLEEIGEVIVRRRELIDIESIDEEEVLESFGSKHYHRRYNEDF